jgi:hypothetical protein
MRLRVCPRCGSKNIFAGKMSSGILYGVSSWMEECRDCGYKGSPVIFESTDEYITFLKKLRSSKEEISIVDSNSDEVQVLENDGECGFSSDEEHVHWHQGKWYLELLIAGILGIIVSYSSVYRNVSIFGAGVGALYSVLEFVIFFIFILIGIVIIEYIMFLIINRVKRKGGY